LLKLNGDNNRLVFKQTGTNQFVEIEGTLSGSPGAYTGHPLLKLRQTADLSYFIGDVTGEIQFYTDDTGANFPGPSAFIRTVSHRADGVQFPDTALSLGASYTPGPAVEVLRLEADGNMRLVMDGTIYIGVNGDLTLCHNGSESSIQNNLNNGADLYLRNKANGKKIKKTAYNSAGIEKTLFSVDPNNETAEVAGNTIWHAGNDGSGSGLDADTLDGQDGSFYQNAGNLTSGTIPRARLLGLSQVSNPYICTGKTNVTALWQTVNFGFAYSGLPTVVATADEDRMVRIATLTTTGFQPSRSIAYYPDYPFDSGYIYWIAFGNRP